MPVDAVGAQVEGEDGELLLRQGTQCEGVDLLDGVVQGAAVPRADEGALVPENERFE